MISSRFRWFQLFEKCWVWFKTVSKFIFCLQIYFSFSKIIFVSKFTFWTWTLLIILVFLFSYFLSYCSFFRLSFFNNFRNLSFFPRESFFQVLVDFGPPTIVGSGSYKIAPVSFFFILYSSSLLTVFLSNGSKDFAHFWPDGR